MPRLALDDRPTPPRLSRPSVPELILDCRWLGRGGVGMATELTLRAFAELHTLGEFDTPVTLRGDRARLSPHAWPTAVIEDDLGDPHQWLGQRGWRRDDGRVEMAFHQLRPLSMRSRIQWLHDLIPVHFAKSAVDRRLRLEYLRRVVATSDRLIVVSQHTFRCAVEELGADPARMTVVTYPPDRQLAADVAIRRNVLPQVSRLLYIGRFARHKNLDRLIEAFSKTEFRRHGGVLHLVGGTPGEIEALHARYDLRALRIDVEGTVPRSRIVDLFATSAALIQPSLEEGFGLPVWEARTVGLPVIAANAGSLPELLTDPKRLFDPRDTEQIVLVIDRVCAGASGSPQTSSVGPANSIADFGRSLVARFSQNSDPSAQVPVSNRSSDAADRSHENNFTLSKPS